MHLFASHFETLALSAHSGGDDGGAGGSSGSSHKSQVFLHFFCFLVEYLSHFCFLHFFAMSTHAGGLGGGCGPGDGGVSTSGPWESWEGVGEEGLGGEKSKAQRRLEVAVHGEIWY